MPRKLTDSHPHIDWARIREQARIRYTKGGETFEAIAIWIGITTGYRPTRRTISNWASTDGWLAPAVPAMASEPTHIMHAVQRCGWCDFTRPGRRCVACGEPARAVVA